MPWPLWSLDDGHPAILPILRQGPASQPAVARLCASGRLLPADRRGGCRRHRCHRAWHAAIAARGAMASSRPEARADPAKRIRSSPKPATTACAPPSRPGAHDMAMLDWLPPTQPRRNRGPGQKALRGIGFPANGSTASRAWVNRSAPRLRPPVSRAAHPRREPEPLHRARTPDHPARRMTLASLR